MSAREPEFPNAQPGTGLLQRIIIGQLLGCVLITSAAKQEVDTYIEPEVSGL